MCFVRFRFPCIEKEYVCVCVRMRVGACDFSSALRGKLRLFLSEEYFTLYIVSFSFLYIQILICHLIPFFRYVFLSCSACFCDLIFVPQKYLSPYFGVFTLLCPRSLSVANSLFSFRPPHCLCARVCVDNTRSAITC